MKKMFLFISLFSIINIVYSQIIYDPYTSEDSLMNYEYPASEELLKDAKKRTHYDKGYEFDIYSYQDSKGIISIGDHDRASIAVYDKDLKWIETHVYYYYDSESKSLSKKELKTVQDNIALIVSKLIDDYEVSELDSYTIIINNKGTYYQVQANKKNVENEYYHLFLNDKFELVNKILK